MYAWIFSAPKFAGSTLQRIPEQNLSDGNESSSPPLLVLFKSAPNTRKSDQYSIFWFRVSLLRDWLKLIQFDADPLDRMIRVTLMDGSKLEVPREEALELLPYRFVFTGKNLKAPVEGLVSHRGKLIPVLGPIPNTYDESLPVDKRPWILLLQGCAQVVMGLPEFQEKVAQQKVTPLHPAQKETNSMLIELDALLKSA